MLLMESLSRGRFQRKTGLFFPFKTNVQAFCLECLGVLSEMFRRSL